MKQEDTPLSDQSPCIEELYYGALNAIQYSMVQYLLLIR